MLETHSKFLAEAKSLMAKCKDKDFGAKIAGALLIQRIAVELDKQLDNGMILAKGICKNFYIPCNDLPENENSAILKAANAHFINSLPHHPFLHDGSRDTAYPFNAGRFSEYSDEVDSQTLQDNPKRREHIKKLKKYFYDFLISEFSRYALIELKKPEGETNFIRNLGNCANYELWFWSNFPPELMYNRWLSDVNSSTYMRLATLHRASICPFGTEFYPDPTDVKRIVPNTFVVTTAPVKFKYFYLNPKRIAFLREHALKYNISKTQY